MQKKIKIALMSYAMDNRKAKGTALYTRKLIEGLLSDPKFDLYMVHYDKVDDPLYKKAKEIIMPRVVLPYGSHFVSQMLFFWKYRNDQFDIIHWFQPRVYPLYWCAPAKKIIVTMHGAGDITAPHFFVFSRTVLNFVLKYLHTWIDRVIVVSQDAKNEVVKYYGFEPEKIVSIYNGGGENYNVIDKTSARGIASEKYNISGPYILDVSRFLPHKNVTTLIKSYSLFREKYPLRKELLVVVGGSAYKSEGEYKAREESRFARDIIFVDFVESQDLNAIYSGAEVFVFPSLDEGFGLPVLEAMASGVPVITSNRASMPEIGGEAVITVDPLSVDDISEAINNVLTNRDLRESMISMGLQRAKDFTWARMVEQTEDLYKNIV